MKTNGNNKRISDYYIGLDVGTESVGWAVTDCKYNILRFKGTSMWGIRLFNEAQGAEERRRVRTSRRRLARCKQRLNILEMLFNDLIAEKDPNFFIRLSESSLVMDDKKQCVGKYTLFNDKDFSDKDYLKKYPTIYHLRSELIHSDAEHDIRLVYLALHHILKNRGHFLLNADSNVSVVGIRNAFSELIQYVIAEYDTEMLVSDYEKLESVLTDSNLNITNKKKALKGVITALSQDASSVSVVHICEALAGAKVKLADLFCDESLKNANIKSVTLKDDIDEKYDDLASVLGDNVELILELKKFYDIAHLAQILGKEKYISDSKVNLYCENKSDLNLLKRFVKEKYEDKYKLIFNIQSNSKANNYAAYSGYKLNGTDYSCNQESFCKFLSEELPMLAECPEYESIWKKIQDKTLLPKLKGTDNGVIPCQLHRSELKAILHNACKYIPALSEKDETGLSIVDKVIATFDFKVPYYVGPLNKKSQYSWVERTNEKIYPWNFQYIVDTEKSAQVFISNLIGKCTYTGEKVLPMDSLIYSKYTVLNEINPLKINGNPIPVSVKQEIYTELFENSKAKITKKTIKNFLLCRGYISAEDEISGVDDVVKSKLKSQHDFARILEKTKDTAMVEDIIKSILVFGEDKKMLRTWLKKEYKCLSEDDIKYICTLKYKDWGRLSKEFLTEINTPDEYGELHSIIDMMWSTNNNLNQLLSGSYAFSSCAEQYKSEKFGTSHSLDEILEDMYISPAVRRSVKQTLKIVDEIVDIKKSAPQKIFVEVARENMAEKKRTVSRKQRLLDLYANCREEAKELSEQLESEAEERLRSDKLYLYYAQFGKCMYSGEAIDFEQCMKDNTKYDIDHIYPRSKIKDDSLDNRVLVKSELNREKTNEYPIKSEIRASMKAFWTQLKNKNLISEKKYERLTRSNPLTLDELSSFVARQLVETQQSTKALATIMKELYPESKIVYSKAGNVSDFRQEYKFVKCRDINDFHHAKDAYLNIVVGNVYDTKFTSKFFSNIENENYSLNKVFAYSVNNAWEKDSDIVTVKKTMAKNNILYTRMPFAAKGSLFDLNILCAGKGQLPVKEGKSIEKYGGYNSLSGAYFFVVEHNEKGRRIRTIEPVLVYKRNEYESNPEKYCIDILNLKDPVIIAPKILIDSLLEIDGMRLNVSGRGDVRILYTHAFQLVVSPEEEIRIKAIQKYIERCKAANAQLKITDYDGITEQTNIALYDAFANKLKNTSYSLIFGSMTENIIKGRDTFESLSLYKQCIVLCELLKAFRCNSMNPDLSLINSSKTAGIVRFSKNITKRENAYLVNQSVTGLYSYKLDLLK